MNTSALRQQLHQYIDEVDDKKIEAIFSVLQPDINRQSSYTDEELRMFYERREKYLSGNTGTYTAEEAHDYIRKHR